MAIKKQFLHMKKAQLRKLKIKALLLLFLMLFQIIFPSIGWALTFGTTQPEFAAYEEPNTTDMVNLITGDFTYNIPIFEVPSPEGGFRLPLSYHAGIQLDEESSWVGLGWSMNAGAIARNVNQYPDDYEGKQLSTSMIGLKGNGYVDNYILYQDYYDSQKGHGGTFGYGNVFKIGTGSMKESTTVLGVSGKGANTKIDAVGFVSGVTEIAILVGSFGSSAFSETAAYADLNGLDMALTTYQAFNAASASNSNSLAISSSDWKTNLDKGVLSTNYSYYLDATKTEHMFGSLYLNKVDDDAGVTNESTCLHPFLHNNSITSINNSNKFEFVPVRFAKAGYNAVSDMHMNNDGAGEFAYLIAPTSIAYDNYNVMGVGVSGDIKPFRTDVGSLSYPNLGDPDNAKYDIANYMDYKVNFKYSNDNANSYTHSLGDNSDNVSNPAYGFTLNNFDNTSEDCAQYLSCKWDGSSVSHPPMEDYDHLDDTEPWVQNGIFPNWLITDNTINSEFQPGYISGNRKEADRSGLKNNHLASGKFVQWYSNAEILNGDAKADGFIDFLDDSQRAAFRASTSLPSEGIGGFMITREDGLTYHYSLPVYNKTTYTYLKKANGLDVTLADGNKFAFDWLLTGITGPDFVDRGTIGVIDEQDYGYWVKMDYGLFSSNYVFRDPYIGTHYSPASLAETSYSKGIKETYYLNKISTRTHTALFIKSLKSDGKSYFGSEMGSPIQNAQPSSSLKLDDVVLFTNQDYQTLITAVNDGGMGLAPDFNSGNGNSTIGNGDIYDNVLDDHDINSTIQSFIDAKQIRKVHFNYSYDLCGKTYNSFDLISGGSAPSSTPEQITARKGKLTLASVDVFGKNNFKIIPPFIFNYGNVNDLTSNPIYNGNKWDGWGMYKSSAGYDLSSHKASNEVSQWSLQEVTTPMGAKINIKYERDSYSSVNGNNIGINNIAGGDLRVKEIAIIDENGQALKTKYVYTIDGNENTNTSGVVSFEPEFSRNQNFNFYNYYDNPVTPVLYSKVTVYSNSSNSSNNNYLIKQEYNFTTPNQSYLTFSDPIRYYDDEIRSVKIQDFLTKPDVYMKFRAKMYNMIFKNYTSKIGSLNSIKAWNSKNDLLNEATFKYTDNSLGDIPDKQGIYGESTIFSDRVKVASSTEPTFYYRLNRTSKVSFPYILKEIDVTSAGQTVITKNEDFNFITGQPTTTTITYPNGQKDISKVVPAYFKYPDMGSKVDDINNKNMLSQNTAFYNYVSIGGGTEKLISANVQTWKNIWDYREFISSAYADDEQTDIWRKYRNYTWKSAVNDDGTVAGTFIDFDWTSTPNSAWKKTNEVTRYDHYSQALESKDINGNYSAVKKGGLSDNFVIATSGTSNYKSFVHTGFEDLHSNNYFGGEVFINDGLQIVSGSDRGIESHTGNYLVKIPQSGLGPIYKVSTGLQTGKTYRASVWIHGISNSSTTLVAQLDGSTNISQSMNILNPKAVHVGDWVLLTVNISVPQNYTPTGGSNNDLRVYVYTGSGGVAYIDDMRLQPVDSPVTGYIYDEKTGLLTAMLDNENFATVFTYDAAGRLIKTEKETAKGIKKVSESFYHYHGMTQ